MAQFLLMIYVDPDDPQQHPEPESDAYADLLQRYYDLDAETKAAGVLIESGALQPPTASLLVQVRQGETLTTNASLSTTRERLDGFYLVECDSLDKAVRWAAKIPHALTSTVEIRTLVAFPDPT